MIRRPPVPSPARGTIAPAVSTSRLTKPVRELTACVVDNGLFVELARVLGQTYKQVYYHVPWQTGFPVQHKGRLGYGYDGITPLLSMFDPAVFDDIDLFIFPDIGHGPEQLLLQRLGKLVWGSRMGEYLELDRDGTKTLMQQLGLPVGPYQVVTGIEALRAFLQTHPGWYVKIDRWRGHFETFCSTSYDEIKPRLDELAYRLGEFGSITDFVCEKALPNKVELGIDAYCVDGQFPEKLLSGIEIKDRAYCGFVSPYSLVPEAVTRYNSGVEPALRAYQYRGFYSSEVRVGKDQVGYMIDHCFDDETDVLTDAGWKRFADCTIDDLFATRDPNGVIVYQHAERLIARRYAGPMMLLTSPKQVLECLVTPEHEILRTDRLKRVVFKEKANALTDKGYIPRTGLWGGDDSLTTFSLPAYTSEWDFFGRTGKFICQKVHHDPACEIPMETWAAFLGWYLSEGSLSTSRRFGSVVQISQSATSRHLAAIRSVLDALPWSYHYDDKMFRICSVQLAEHLKQFGKAADKHVPAYIKQATPAVIRAFLEAFNRGDGSLRYGKRHIYYTSSRQMADDLQELIFKSGSVANITVTPLTGTKMSVCRRTYIRKHDKYTIHQREEWNDYWFETQKRKSQYLREVSYDGMVYCATVPNGTLYVRRHGKPFWSGNCARAASPPNEAYQMLYTNLAEIIARGAAGEMVQPVTNARFASEVIVHSSWALKNWQGVTFPSEYREHVKLRNAVKIDGHYWVVPQADEMSEIGAIVGLGDTLQESIDQVKAIAKSVKGYGLEIPVEALDEAEGEADKARAFGISIFGKQ